MSRDESQTQDGDNQRGPHTSEEQNVYEYNVDELKIDTVKGKLRIGKEILERLPEEDGLHRFFIEKITIKTIEGTGSVVIGVAEKGKEGKKRKKRVPPEKAKGDIKKIYEDIGEAWGVDAIPVLFQRLAVKQDVLKLIWEWVKSYELDLLAAQIQEELRKELEERLQLNELLIGSNLMEELKDLKAEIRGHLTAETKGYITALLMLSVLSPEYASTWIQRKTGPGEEQLFQPEESSSSFLKQAGKQLGIDTFPKLLQTLQKQPPIGKKWKELLSGKHRVESLKRSLFEKAKEPVEQLQASLLYKQDLKQKTFLLSQALWGFHAGSVILFLLAAAALIADLDQSG